MKKINKVLLLLLLPLMAEVLIACCECPETTFLSYTNCSLSVTNLDNSGDSPVIAQSQTIPKKAYGVKMSVSRNEDICELRKNKSLFIPSANAISCGCPPEFQYRPLDSIISVNIITLNDFDAEHMESSDVTELFYVFERNDFASLSDYIGLMENVLNDFMRPTFELTLLLMSPPTTGFEHQFEVSITLSDGRILRATTEPIGLIQ